MKYVVVLHAVNGGGDEKAFATGKFRVVERGKRSELGHDIVWKQK